MASVWRAAPIALLTCFLAAPAAPRALAGGEGASDTSPAVTEEHRRAAEASWLMMTRMQGLSGDDSALLRDLERRGVEPAPMAELDLSEGTASAHAGHGKRPPRVWSEVEYLRHHSRLGVPPPPDGYRGYLRRMGVLPAEGGETASRFPLEVADEEARLAHLAAELGMPGATVKRGRDTAAAPAEVRFRHDPGAGSPSPAGGSGQELRVFDVAAIETDIVYHRAGLHDPHGMLYVLEEDRQRVLACQGFECGHDPLFFGWRGDPRALSPQPLVLRANVGDTVLINLTNRTADQRVSIHIHKALYRADAGGSKTGYNADSTVGPGESIRYEWEIPDEDWAEGIYYFYSHGDPRFQVAHGLFGALIVEPRGSRYLDTRTGEPLPAGYGAIIVNDDPSVRAFREYVLFFQDRLELVEANGNQPLDNFTGVPDPAGKGFNYRSEPFYTRLNLYLDESMSYSAYAFGDASTPHPGFYVGDPMRLRVVHGGSGEHHVFHNHAHRWRVNPREAPGRENNLTEPSKGGERDLVFPVSTRIDSQTMGPGEVFDVFMEGGAGGMQRTVGDVAYHCHIIEHVLEGLWSYHRIFNTLQPDLAPLPDREPPPQAVNSLGLLELSAQGKPAVVQTGGRFYGQAITAQNLEDWIRWQLPPPGVPDEELIVDPEHGNRTQNKAHRWDWVFEDTERGPLAKGEPYDDFFGPGHPAAGEGIGAGPPGERPELLFNPADGRLAWPHLKPHLGRRPPFALVRDGDPDTQGTAYLGLHLDPGAFDGSGAEAGSGLIPTHSSGGGSPTRIRRYDIEAISLPIRYNAHGDRDPDGMIYVLADDVPAIRSGAKPAEPLVIRANVGEGIQLSLRSSLTDSPEADYHSKAAIHVHLVQYDVQSSDGAVIGLNYENQVRPSRDEAGNPIEGRRACGVGVPTDCGPLDRRDEVVHLTWFADTELGTVYWHDHSQFFALSHGLFGALIVEPEGAEYKDPETGEDKYVADRDGRYTSTSGTSGTQVADIHLPASTLDPRTGAKRADFREFFLGINDATTLFGKGIYFASIEHGESRRNAERGYTTLNLRTEPFVHRLRQVNDASLVYSSHVHGDPSTPLWRAYVGDPVALRLEAGGSNSVHTFQLHGHRWRFQRGDPDSSPLRDFVVLGQSEAFTLELEGGAGGTVGAPGDYLYFDGDMDHRFEGAWGLFRVHDTLQLDLRPLPDRAPPGGSPAGGSPAAQVASAVAAPQAGERPPKAADSGDPGAPPHAPVRRYDVVAFDMAIPYDTLGTVDALGKILALAADVQAIREGDKPTEPLVLRASAGEVVEIRLENRLHEARVGLHASLLDYDVRGSDGAAAGWNADQTAAPGETVTYRWYADRAYGTIYLYNPGSLDHTRHGLFGALIVEPAGSTWTDPRTGEPLASGWAADVVPGDGSEPFREFALFFHDGVDQIRYRVAINYRTARRMGANEVIAAGPTGVARTERELAVHDSETWGDPITPMPRAYDGDRVILRHLQPAFEDHHSFHLHGHTWLLEPGDEGSQHLAAITDSVGTAYDLELQGGARAGDHLFHCHIMDHKVMGMWGIFRVYPAEEPQPDLRPLPERAADRERNESPSGGSLRGRP